MSIERPESATLFETSLGSTTSSMTLSSKLSSSKPTALVLGEKVWGHVKKSNIWQQLDVKGKLENDHLWSHVWFISDTILKVTAHRWKMWSLVQVTSQQKQSRLKFSSEKEPMCHRHLSPPVLNTILFSANTLA